MPGNSALRSCGAVQLVVTSLWFPPNNEYGVTCSRNRRGSAAGQFSSYFRRLSLLVIDSLTSTLLQCHRVVGYILYLISGFCLLL